MKPKDFLIKHRACNEAIDWAEQFETVEQAWEACERGDWMLRIAQKIGANDKSLPLAKGHCANTVRHLMQDKRSIAAVDAAIAYGEGKISAADLKSYADGAYADYAAADAYAAYAAYAASAVDATVDAAAYAAYAAAFDAAYAVDAAAKKLNKKDFSEKAKTDPELKAAAAAKKKNQKDTADICRQYLTEAFLEKIGGSPQPSQPVAGSYEIKK